jgi:hypothetical protein
MAAASKTSAAPTWYGGVKSATPSSASGNSSGDVVVPLGVDSVEPTTTKRSGLVSARPNNPSCPGPPTIEWKTRVVEVAVGSRNNLPTKPSHWAGCCTVLPVVSPAAGAAKGRSGDIDEPTPGSPIVVTPQ